MRFKRLIGPICAMFALLILASSVALASEAGVSQVPMEVVPEGEQGIERVPDQAPAGGVGAADSQVTALQAEANPDVAERTVLLYVCGSDLEGAGLATHNLMQILESNFSKTGDVRFVVMTGGSDSRWSMQSDRLCKPDGSQVDRVNKNYNQVWEARGADAEVHPGKMILLEEKGLSGRQADSGDNPELMSDPNTLKAFINYGVAHYPAKKYDLILWDHGGGPVDGYAVDEHKPEGLVPPEEADYEGQTRALWMSFSQIIDALAHNDVTKNTAV